MTAEVFRVPGLGTFRKSFRKACLRNPSNGEQMVVQKICSKNDFF